MDRYSWAPLHVSFLREFYKIILLSSPLYVPIWNMKTAFSGVLRIMAPAPRHDAQVLHTIMLAPGVVVVLARVCTSSDSACPPAEQGTPGPAGCRHSVSGSLAWPPLWTVRGCGAWRLIEAQSSPHPSAPFRPCLRQSKRVPARSVPSRLPLEADFDRTERAGTHSDGRKRPEQRWQVRWGPGLTYDDSRLVWHYISTPIINPDWCKTANEQTSVWLAVGGPGCVESQDSRCNADHD